MRPIIIPFRSSTSLFVLILCAGLVALQAAAQSRTVLAYTFSTLAGKAAAGSVDGAGDAAQFSQPRGLASDSMGNIYVADKENHTIRRITPAGVVSTIAGVPGAFGSADGTGSGARFYLPEGIVVDSADNLYITDFSNTTIRKMVRTGTNWVVSTIAGLAGVEGIDDGLGSGARFAYPVGIAADMAGNLFVADTFSHTIRKLTAVGTNWVVSTIAGLAAQAGYDDGIGSAARFNRPQGIAADGVGNLYVADTRNQTLRKITSDGTNWTVSTIAGLAEVVGVADGTGSQARFYEPYGITLDQVGNLFVADKFNNRVRRISPSGTNWMVVTLAGSIRGGRDGTGTNAWFNRPSGIAVDAEGVVYLSDSDNNTIRRVTSAGIVSTMAGLSGSFGSADGTGRNARFNFPLGIAADRLGNLYVTDTENLTIRRITGAGVVSTFAGSVGAIGSADGVGNNARFYSPDGIAVDFGGNVYVADLGNNTIRKITPAGVVSTLAGLAGSEGSNDGIGSDARFKGPHGITVDAATNVYVADTFNQTIRKISPAGVVTTLAGLVGVTGLIDGTNSQARFRNPFGIAVDSAGTLYVADTHNQAIRKVTPAGIVTTIAGAEAGFNYPFGIAADDDGNVYVADTENHVIRKINSAGLVETIGGSGFPGSIDGPGGNARFNFPNAIALDGEGQLYIADTYNATIRKGVFTAYGSATPSGISPPLMNGSLTVTLVPSTANGQWRFPWEFVWRSSGATISNLVAGNYPIEFRNVSGYLALPIQPVQVTSGNTTSITNEYLPTISAGDANSAPGSLTVFLGSTPPASAGWRFLGESTPFFGNAFTTNLLPGTYLIEFAAVSERVKPPSQSVQINSGQPTYLSVNYLLAASPPANVYLPFLVPNNVVNDETTFPFGFNGQLQSDTGYGSGVAVSTNVVLTAAHLVFNDQTLSYVNRAHWFFRRNAGVQEPLPLEARGFYLLSGYAMQRSNDLFSGSAPEQSTPPSRNLDVAALYFLLPVAGGGHGGYLPSDAVPNTWLSSTALKILVGYPVDGSQFGDASITTNAGKMYQTDPQPFPLSLANDSVPGQQQEVYEAPWFLSYPGNSGGPLYVQLNGYYYPAAVYLGTRFSGAQPVSSLVRAIDSNVVNLITLAALQGDSGTNFTGGGVITIVPSANITANNPGYVQVRLAPPAAVRAGAAWRLSGDAAFSTATNYTRAVTSTNSFGIEFKPVSGWNLPTNQSLTLAPNQISYPTGFYTVTNPLLVINRNVGIGLTGTTGTTYRVEQRASLTGGAWWPVNTNTINFTGFNLILPKPLTNPPTTFYRLQWLP